MIHAKNVVKGEVSQRKGGKWYTKIFANSHQIESKTSKQFWDYSGAGIPDPFGIQMVGVWCD